MLRLFRPLGGIRAARIAARNGRKSYQGQPITVQRVRLFTARNFVRNTVVGGCIAYLCYHVYDTVVISPVLRSLDKEYASLSTKEKKELDDELADVDDSIFVPLPFTTTRVQPSPYRGSDPEWAQFGKISKDKKLQTRIRHELAGIVKQVVESQPTIVQVCGNNMKLKRYWLDIDFPYRPPPTFEQSGILWDEDGIHWASDTIDSATVSRMQKILRPTAVAQSSYAFTSALAKQHWSEFQRLLGFEVPTPPNPFTRSGKATLDQPSLPSAGRQTPDGTPADARSGPGNNPAGSQQSSDALSGGRTNFLKDAAVSHPGDVRPMPSGPWVEFVKKLSETWAPTRNYPPRGSVTVSGFVEIESSKGFIVVDVLSHWDPKTKKFHSGSQLLNIRRIQMKVQSPVRQ